MTKNVYVSKNKRFKMTVTKVGTEVVEVVIEPLL